MNTNYRKPNQIIHPYYFADGEEDKENYLQKRTCLWLRGVPKLKRTNNLLKPEPMYICQGEKRNGEAIGWCEGELKIQPAGKKEEPKQEAKPSRA